MTALPALRDDILNGFKNPIIDPFLTIINRLSSSNGTVLSWALQDYFRVFDFFIDDLELSHYYENFHSVKTSREQKNWGGEGGQGEKRQTIRV